MLESDVSMLVTKQKFIILASLKVLPNITKHLFLTLSTDTPY